MTHYVHTDTVRDRVARQALRYDRENEAVLLCCGSGTSHFWQSMQNKSADVELQIFGSQGRAEMRKRNIRSLAVKAEQKCGSGISDL